MVHDDAQDPSHAEAPPAPEETLRQPPQDNAAEQSVLGGMLLSKDAIADVLERIKPDDFYKPAHQAVYDAILEMYGRSLLYTSPSPTARTRSRMPHSP